MFSDNAKRQQSVSICQKSAVKVISLASCCYCWPNKIVGLWHMLLASVGLPGR